MKMIEQITVTHIVPEGSTDCMEEIRITRTTCQGKVTVRLARLQHPNRGKDGTFDIVLSESLADEIGRALLKAEG